MLVHQHKLQSRIPRKKLYSLFEMEPKVAFEQYRGWKQYTPKTIEASAEIKKILAKVLGIDVLRIDSCILHFIQGDVPGHRDRMSTGTYAIPLRFSKTGFFFIEEQVAYFKKGYCLKFSDYWYHGISNDYCSKIILITADTKPLPRKKKS